MKIKINPCVGFENTDILEGKFLRGHCEPQLTVTASEFSFSFSLV